MGWARRRGASSGGVRRITSAPQRANSRPAAAEAAPRLHSQYVQAVKQFHQMKRSAERG